MKILAMLLILVSSVSYAGNPEQDPITANHMKQFSKASVIKSSDDVSGAYTCRWRSAHENNFNQGSYFINLIRFDGQYINTKKNQDYLITNLGLLGISKTRNGTYYESIRSKSSSELIVETSVYTGHLTHEETVPQGLVVPGTKIGSYSICIKL